MKASAGAVGIWSDVLDAGPVKVLTGLTCRALACRVNGEMRIARSSNHSRMRTHRDLATTAED